MNMVFCGLFLLLTFFSTDVFAQEKTDAAPAVNAAAPAPTMRQGMKFIPLDRKKMVTRNLSKNQPVVIRPRSPIVNRNNANRKKDKDAQIESTLKTVTKNPVRIDNNSSAAPVSNDAVLSIYPSTDTDELQ